MEQTVKLPYCSRYFPGDQIRLGWLKAITSNDCISARHLNWHTHDELELIFPLRGHYRYEFRGRKPVAIGSGSFLVIPGGMSHRMSEAIDPPGVRLHLYLKSPPEIRTTNGSFTKQEYRQIYQALSGQSLRRVLASAILKTYTSHLGKIVTKGPSPLSAADRLQVRFLCCLTLCNSSTSHATAADSSPSQTFAAAVNWLKRNYSANVRMDELIARIGYSRARFFVLFKQQTNMTPSEYLRNIRLEKAKEMLLQTNLPACSIGRACGFGDPAHFTRLFCKMTGYTPLTYRRRAEETHTS